MVFAGSTGRATCSCYPVPCLPSSPALSVPRRDALPCASRAPLPSTGEMRVVHQMAEQLNRDVVLGTTSVEKPTTFVDLLYSLAPASEDVI